MAKENRQKFAGIDGGTGQENPAGAGADGSNGTGGADDGDGDDGDDGEGDGDEAKKKPEPKYTDDDVNGIVEKRLARERAKMAKEIREKLADEAAEAKTEAQKLEGMTELDRLKHEAEKLRREKEELELQKNLTDQMAVARRELADADISLGDELLGMFVAPDAETTGEAIDKIKELWPKALNSAVQAALKRTPPHAESPANQKSFGASFAEEYNKKMNGGTNNGV